MSRIASIVIAVWAVAIELASFSAADPMSFHATGTGDVGFTDNVFQEQRGNQDGDLFFQLRPGFLFSYGLPRMMHELAGELEITQYTLHNEEASVAGRAGWNALLLPGPRSELNFAANAGTGVTSALTARLPPNQTLIELQPLSNQNFWSADASHYGSYLVSREIRIAERLFGRINETSDNANDRDPDIIDTVVTSGEVGGALTFEYRWSKTQLSLDGGASVMRLDRFAPLDAMQPSRLDRQVNPRGRIGLQRDLSRRYSASADVGLVYVIPYGTDPYNPNAEMRESGLYPVLGAQLAYTDAWGVATGMVRRDVTPNLFLGQNTVNDTAVLSAALPLPFREDNRRRQPKLIGLGTLGLARTQLIDPMTAELQSSFVLARVDVGVQYTVRPGFSYSLRYELLWQSGDQDAVTPVNGFFRNTFFFSFKYRYPEDVAAVVPKKRGRAVRADGSDQSLPGGAEPVITDLLEDGEGGRR